MEGRKELRIQDLEFRRKERKERKGQKAGGRIKNNSKGRDLEGRKSEGIQSSEGSQKAGIWKEGSEGRNLERRKEIRIQDLEFRRKERKGKKE